MKFQKMHAAGNDFILIDDTANSLDNISALAVILCHRHYSVGADGIMIARHSQKYDIEMVYYNSDGSRGEICGNGIRCFAKYVYDQGLIKSRSFKIGTLAGPKQVRISDHGQSSVSVNLGIPQFDPAEIPLELSPENAFEFELNVGNRKFFCSAVKIGVPHLVIFLNDLVDMKIEFTGPEIEQHPLFPKGINVNFVKKINRQEIEILTWERGAGNTLACGTGACASVIVGSRINLLDNKVKVRAEGGILNVDYNKKQGVTLSGPVNKICRGELLNI